MFLQSTPTIVCNIKISQYHIIWFYLFLFLPLLYFVSLNSFQDYNCTFLKPTSGYAHYTVIFGQTFYLCYFPPPVLYCIIMFIFYTACKIGPLSDIIFDLDPTHQIANVWNLQYLSHPWTDLSQILYLSLDNHTKFL